MSNVLTNGPSLKQISVCLPTPAFLPDSFWDLTAANLDKRGVDCVIPPIIRDRVDVGIQQNIDIIKASMDGKTNQFFAVCSRAIEYFVRYVDRAEQEGELFKILGGCVMGSVGPRSYETISPDTGKPYTRHTQQHIDGISRSASGLETLNPIMAKNSMLHDIKDRSVRDSVAGNLVNDRPLSDAEVAEIPDWKPGLVHLTWYIGHNDRVDNLDLSDSVAREKFGVKPQYTDWGHIGPITHADEVCDAIIKDALHALDQQKGRGR